MVLNPILHLALNLLLAAHRYSAGDGVAREGIAQRWCCAVAGVRMFER